MGDIVITVPQSIKWVEYQKELDAAESGDILNFKVGNFPKGVEVGKSKCYICYKGEIIGYHIICGLSSDDFDCTTTGRDWSGKFIQRSGKLHILKNRIPYKGFQGFRYIDLKIM